MLLVFSISVTPRVFFHDLAAHHKDVLTCNLSHPSPALHVQGFNCHFDDLVVAVPFIIVPDQVLNSPVSYKIVSIPIPCTHALPSFTSQTDNRGPPLFHLS